MSGLVTLPLTAAAQTGNNTHNAVGASPAGRAVAVEFNVEAVGATPTVTYALQGTLQESPGANDWVPVALIPSDSDTAAATRTATTVGRTVSHVSQAQSRFFRKYRIVTTLNTNVTYSANLIQQQ